MPRGSELYSPTSQALLRAARMGQVNRPKPTPAEDEKEPGEDDDAEGDIDTGYVAIKWSQVPKEMEEPEMEFLAKRRKGLPSVYGGNVGIQGSATQMTKMKVRRVDAEGNAYVWDVLVPEGTVVEGEIVEGDGVTTEAPAPGTVVEGVGIANAEGVVIAGDQVIPTLSRRRPPPPKRKAKGPGRGRRKRPIGVNGVAGASLPSHPAGSPTEGGVSLPNVDKQAGRTKAAGKNETIEMGDELVTQDGEEVSDEEEDEGDEGDEGEDIDREEGELSPTPDYDAACSIVDSPTKQPPPIVIAPMPSQGLDTGFLNVIPSQISREPSSSPDLPLASEQANNIVEITIYPVPETPVLPQPSPLLEPVDTVEPITKECSATVSSDTAELPTGQIPLKALAMPQVVKVDQKLHLGAGESDLFGSLERHLNEKS